MAKVSFFNHFWEILDGAIFWRHHYESHVIFYSDPSAHVLSLILKDY
jgi:hypothetical protein